MDTIKFVLFAILLTANVGLSQTIIGKIFTKNEADDIFGQVYTSVEVSSDLLNILTSYTQDYMMFRISFGNLIILGDQRKLLYPGDIIVDPKEEMRLFSVSLVKKLLTDGNESTTKIELRKNDLLTITNGNYTLDFSAGCPPFCDPGSFNYQADLLY